MKRTTISLPEELLDRLRRIAAEQRTPIASVIREAIEEKVGAYRPKPRSLGIGSSGSTHTVRGSGDERPGTRPWR